MRRRVLTATERGVVVLCMRGCSFGVARRERRPFARCPYDGGVRFRPDLEPTLARLFQDVPRPRLAGMR